MVQRSAERQGPNAEGNSSQRPEVCGRVVTGNSYQLSPVPQRCPSPPSQQWNNLEKTPCLLNYELLYCFKSPRKKNHHMSILETSLILEQLLCGTFSPVNLWEIHRGGGLHCSVSLPSHQNLCSASYAMSHMLRTKILINHFLWFVLFFLWRSGSWQWKARKVWTGLYFTDEFQISYMDFSLNFVLFETSAITSVNLADISQCLTDTGT